MSLIKNDRYEKLINSYTERSVTFSDFQNNLYCQHCGKPVFLKEFREYSYRDWDCFKPCPHVVFMYEELSGFLKVRPDFGQVFMEYLLGEEKYAENLLEYKETIPSAYNRVYLPFADGTFMCSEHIGYRIGKLLSDLPYVLCPDAIADNTLIYDSFYIIGQYYVGGYNNYGSVSIGLNPSEYHPPEKLQEGATGIKAIC